MPPTIPDPGFPDDHGEAPEPLARALTAYDADPARAPEVVHALAGSRVLVPVLAVLAEEATVAPGELRREKSVDMAVPTLQDGRGARALPVFSSLATLARWDGDARPVPVEAARAALQALADGTTALVLDIAGPVTCTVGGAALHRLARGEPCLPLYGDPAVATDVHAAVRAEPALAGALLEPAPGSDARLTLHPAPDAGPAAVAEAARRVAARLQASDAVRAASTHGLEVAVQARTGAGPAGPPGQ